MNFTDFSLWLEENTGDLKNIAILKGIEKLIEQNNELDPKKRMKDDQLKKIANNMWFSSLEMLYNEVKTRMPKDNLKRGYDGWIKYLKEKDIAASFREGFESL